MKQLKILKDTRIILATQGYLNTGNYSAKKATKIKTK